MVEVAAVSHLWGVSDGRCPIINLVSSSEQSGSGDCHSYFLELTDYGGLQMTVLMRWQVEMW